MSHFEPLEQKEVIFHPPLKYIVGSSEAELRRENPIFEKSAGYVALGAFLCPVHLILCSLREKNMLCSTFALGEGENEMYPFCYQQEIPNTRNYS